MPPRGSGDRRRQAEVIGATDDDGRFEVRVSDPGALRVIVSDTAHDPCVRDFTAAELGGTTPVEWSCYTPQRAPAALNETRVRARPEHPEETRQTLTQRRADHGPGHASAIRCACCRTCPASRARRSAWAC